MNLVLFREQECAGPIPIGDPRIRHILEVLRLAQGGSFDCGLIDGPRGKATLLATEQAQVVLSFHWDAQPPPPLSPTTLLVGLPRPQTARKILYEATTLGIARIVFFHSDRGERSYAESTLWRSGEVERLLVSAAEQAFCTRLPAVERRASLDAALAALDPDTRTRAALDNYEAACGLAEALLAGAPAALAVGSERGWSGAERSALRAAGFTLVHLGARVLRTETACTAGLAVLQARLGQWQSPQGSRA